MDLSLLKQDVHKLCHRITNAEQRIGDLEDESCPIQATVNDLCKGREITTDKLTDVENHLRRNNLHFLGFPESAEGRNPEAFMENWLTTTFLELPHSLPYLLLKEYLGCPSDIRRTDVQCSSKCYIFLTERLS